MEGSIIKLPIIKRKLNTNGRILLRIKNWNKTEEIQRLVREKEQIAGENESLKQLLRDQGGAETKKLQQLRDHHEKLQQTIKETEKNHLKEKEIIHEEMEQMLKEKEIIREEMEQMKINHALEMGFSQKG